MGRALTFPAEVTEFEGLNERESGHNSHRLPFNQALALDNLRPAGGILQVVGGNTLHSTIQDEAVSRPTTLIRYSAEAGTTAFLATAWMGLYLFSSNVWNEVTSPSRLGGYVPLNQLWNPNYPFSHFIRNDYLYLTDGQNTPIKYHTSPHGSSWQADYNAYGTMGTWGMKAFNRAQSSPATNEISAITQTAAGAFPIIDVDLNYYITLYDSIRGLESNIGSAQGARIVNLAGSAKKFWLYVDKDNFKLTNSYDYDNQFADKIRIYRQPGNPLSITTPRYRLAELRKGIVSSAGTSITVTAVTGAVVGTGTKFKTDGTIAGYALFANGLYWQITACPDDTHLTIVDDDGTGYTGGTFTVSTFYVLGGVVDNNPNITANAIYHGDDTTLLAYQRDHSPSPNCAYCTMVGDRTFRAIVSGNSAHPNRIYWSWPDNPDYFYIPDQDGGDWLDINPDDGDQITGQMLFQGRLYIFKRNSVSVLTCDGDPSNWTLTNRIFNVGAESQRVIADCDGILVFASHSGVFSYGNGDLSDISHNRNRSNIVQSWEKIVANEWPNACAIYHKKRREYWLTVCLNDERNLYNSALSGLGDGHTGFSPVLWGDDNPLPPQNNMTFAYRLETGDWYRIPIIGATCWTIFDKKRDQDHLYRGDYGGAVIREDVSFGVQEIAGECGICNSGASNTNLIKLRSMQTWTTDEWKGGTLYLRGGTATAETREIISNNATTLNIGGKWVSNPVINDRFQIIKRTGTLYEEDGVCNGWRAYETGTATGGGSANLIDTAKSWGTNQLIHAILILRPGAGNQEWAVVLSNTNNIITVKPGTVNGSANTWTSIPVAGNAYAIHCAIRDTVSGKNWALNAHTGRIVFLRDGTSTGEWGTIVRNSAAAMQVSDFNGNPAATNWTVSPSATDEYKIWKLTPTVQSVPVKYRTPMLHFGDVSALKAFIETMIRAYGTGTLNIAWEIDGGEKPGGTVQFQLAQATTVWGSFNWGTVDNGTTLIWGALGTVIDSFNFDENAEGYMLAMEMTLDTNSDFKLYFWSFDYHKHSGVRWLR